MLIEVCPNLVVADMEGCGPLGVGNVGAVIHGCKNPCHLRAVGYTGSLPKDHPEYLMARRGDDLYLNIVDAPIPIFRREIFVAALDFLDEHAGSRTIVHCNNGLSRAPSTACLWLAKRAKVIPQESWLDAKAAFLTRMPSFKPGLGIDTFLTEHWAALA